MRLSALRLNLYVGRNINCRVVAAFIQYCMRINSTEWTLVVRGISLLVTRIIYVRGNASWFDASFPPLRAICLIACPTEWATQLMWCAVSNASTAILNVASAGRLVISFIQIMLANVVCVYIPARARVPSCFVLIHSSALQIFFNLICVVLRRRHWMIILSLLTISSTWVA